MIAHGGALQRGLNYNLMRKENKINLARQKAATDRDKELERELDKELAASFPASDPPAMAAPGSQRATLAEKEMKDKNKLH